MIQSEFQVNGMSCGHCEGAVQGEISKIAGVNRVEASAATGTVIVESDGELAREAVAGAVSEAGYELV